jgi:hypothetical protein
MSCIADELARKPDFSALEARVNDAQRKRLALEDMLRLLQSTNNFDAQDSRSVEELLLKVMKEQQAAGQELSRREAIYQEELLGAQKQLMARHNAMSQLNDTTEAFDLFPELAQKFARRQAEMIRKVAETTRRLETL